MEKLAQIFFSVIRYCSIVLIFPSPAHMRAPFPPHLHRSLEWSNFKVFNTLKKLNGISFNLHFFGYCCRWCGYMLYSIWLSCVNHANCLFVALLNFLLSFIWFLKLVCQHYLCILDTYSLSTTYISNTFFQWSLFMLSSEI